MFPAFLPLDHGGILLMNFMVVVAWLMFSFLFWRGLRSYAVEEDRVFDLTFYSTLSAFIVARLGFVVTHWELFSGKSLLLIVALWVSPGLSWLGGLIGALALFVLLARRYKVRLGLVLDTLAVALPLPIIIGEVGSLLTASERGTSTRLPWGIRMNTDSLVRHPVQLYEMIALVCISFLVLRLTNLSVKRKWPYGLVGIWFFLLYAVSGFALEFVKETHVYWSTLTANQWMLIGIFAECIGVLYVRGGGREHLRPVALKFVQFFAEKGKKLHESISRRHTH